MGNIVGKGVVGPNDLFSSLNDSMIICQEHLQAVLLDTSFFCASLPSPT